MFRNGMTVGDLKKILNEYNVPDNAIIVCQSDSEGNEMSTCLDVFIDKIGRTEDIAPNYTYTVGEEIQGLDPKENINKTIIILQPNM